MITTKCPCGWETYGNIQAILKRKELHQKKCPKAPQPDTRSGGSFYAQEDE